MPDDVDARGDPPLSTANSPDLVGEELGDGAKIWRVYDRVARDEDRERIGNWNRGLDNLALFAGLFSAVTTAFIIQLQQDVQPDYARLTFLVLNASAAGVQFRDEPFAIDRGVRTTNCLWLTSLMLSLTAALIAIMGKDWIGTYASRPVCNPRQWAEIRTYRLACVDSWYMSGVIASAPVLLHISLVLFAAGLVIFAAPDPFSQHVALGLALAAGGLYLVTVLSAIVFPSSPFKSPATQAFRGTMGSLYTSLYDRMAYPPKRLPIALLQQATLIIGGALSYSLPADLLPLDQSQRRRLRRGDVRTVWNHLFSGRSSEQAGSWRDRTARVFTQVVWARSALSPSALLRSALEEYHYRRQRPHTSPWYSSAQSYLRRTVLSDRWAEVRDTPTPDLLAQSLSHLNAVTQATDVLRSILSALGDIAIGRKVAPLVSLNLKSRLATEIRHNWQNCDLVTLSRYILTGLHVWDTSMDTPMIPYRAIDRFYDEDTAVRSETIIFALIERNFVSGSMLNRYCPDLVIQPRALQYLLPRVFRLDVVIVLAQRYWDHVRTDQSMLESELRGQLRYWAWAWDDIEAKLHRRFGGSPGLLELLVVSLDYLATDIATSACALILKIIASTYPVSERSCLVYAFGNESSRIASAAWAALPAYDHSAPLHYYAILEHCLPLARFAPRRYGKGVTPSTISEDQRAGDICLARTIVRLLLPSRYFCNSSRETSEDPEAEIYVSTLELCVRCLRPQLCHHQSTLGNQEKLEIITLVLENSVLIRICSLWGERWESDPTPTAESGVINILAAIARRLTVLLTSRAADDFNTAARLFCLFSFSEAKDEEGEPVAWDLGSYLRRVADRLSEQDPTTEISMRRLIRALRVFRPLCASRDDLRTAWERINLAPNDDYHDSFWDAEDFQLGPVLDPDVPAASLVGASLPEDTTPPVLSQEAAGLYWLDAAMR